MVLLRVRFRPAAEKLVHGRDSGFEIVLHGPEREVAADVCVEGGEHGGPLAAVFFVDDERCQSTLFSRLDWSCLYLCRVGWESSSVCSSGLDGKLTGSHRCPISVPWLLWRRPTSWPAPRCRRCRVATRCTARRDCWRLRVRCRARGG